MRSALASLVVLLLLLGAACAGEERHEEGTLVLLDPRDGAVFPPDFTPPTFLWEARDTRTERYEITIAFADGSVLRRVVEAEPPPPAFVDERALGDSNEVYVPPHAERRRAWSPEAADWEAIQQRTVDAEATVRIAAGGTDVSVTVRISTSSDPLEGGEAREMRCNTELMNSWHAFSPDGRWMVFYSKAYSPYTQLFLTHIDEQGNDTPPVLIPNSTAANRAANLPEFVNIDYDELQQIEVPAVEHHRHASVGFDLVEAGRFEEAIPVLERAIELDPAFSRAYVTLGSARMEGGDLPGAVTDLKRALELNPASSAGHSNLGLAYLRQGDVDEAIPHLRRAVAIDFLNWQAEYDLGLALARQESYGEALPHLERAAALAPDEVDVATDRGNVLARLGRHPEAREMPAHALLLDANHVRARQVLARSCLATGDHAGAVAAFEAILTRRPEAQPERLRLAWLRATSRDASVRDGRRAVALFEPPHPAPGSPAELDVLAAALAEAGRFAEAVEAAERAQSLAADGRSGLAPGIERRLAAYRARRPWGE